MCTSWKFVGVTALTLSLFYNLLLLYLLSSFLSRCYDDCSHNTEGPYDEDCYATSAMYTLYLPIALASPFIMLTDRNSTNYLRWWLLLHAALTCCAYLIYVCYSPFYTASDSDVNIVGIACLVFSFGSVAFHLYRVVRTPAAQTQSDPVETAA